MGMCSLAKELFLPRVVCLNSAFHLAVVRSLFEHLRGTGQRDVHQIEALAKQYGL